MMSVWRSWLWVVLILAFGLYACSPAPRVVISTKEGKEFAVQVDIAETPGKRKLGLQYRNELPEGQGMLFLFPTQEVQTFWMKNTPISLDMIFINVEMQVVGIVHEAVPFSTELRSVAAPSRFVLEINGGLSRRSGIGVGDTVRFEGISLAGR